MLIAPGAHAVTVTSDEDSLYGPTVSVGGDPGTDELRVTEGRHAITVRSAHARIHARGDCSRQSPRVATCPAEGQTLYIATGGGNDAVHFSAAGTDGVPVTINLGPGNDRAVVRGIAEATVLGRGGADILIGGDRADRLHGGAGSDVLIGNAGDDLLAGDGGGSAAPDRLDGGQGADTASWEGARCGVRVDLTRQRGGEPGMQDRLAQIENVSGTRHPDRLMGDEGPNVLAGGPSRDLLVGHAGRDTLNAGQGLPSLVDDPDRARDRLRCGHGTDYVIEPGLDPIPRDCERLQAPDLDNYTARAQPLPLAPNRLRFDTVCSDMAPSCKRQVVVRVGRHELGRSRLVETKSGVTALTVKMHSRLPRSGVVTVVVRGSDRDYDAFEDEPQDVDYRFVFRLLR